MELVELIDGFLNENGFFWNRTIYGPSMDGPFPAVGQDFKGYNLITYIPVKFKGESSYKYIKMGVIIDSLTFKIIDIKSYSEKVKEFKNKDLSNKWQQYCVKHKGLVYKAIVDREVINMKRFNDTIIDEEINEHLEEIEKLKIEKQRKTEELDNALKKIDNLLNSEN